MVQKRACIPHEPRGIDVRRRVHDACGERRQAAVDNVVLTSHHGWPADLTYGTMAQAVVAIIEAYLDGNYARAVNPEALQHR